MLSGFLQDSLRYALLSEPTKPSRALAEIIYFEISAYLDILLKLLRELDPLKVFGDF